MDNLTSDNFITNYVKELTKNDFSYKRFTTDNNKTYTCIKSYPSTTNTLIRTHSTDTINVRNNKSNKKRNIFLGIGVVILALGVGIYVRGIRKLENNFFKKISDVCKLDLNNSFEYDSKIAKNILKKSNKGNNINIYDLNPNNVQQYVINCGGIDCPAVSYNDAFKNLKTKDYGLINFDYCGLGKSTGKYDKDGSMEAIETVYNYLTQDKGIPAEKIILMGHSYGTGIASEFTKSNKIKSLILVNPFDTFTNAAKYSIETINMPKFLKKLIKRIPEFMIPIKTKLNNVKNIKKTNVPTLILASKDDHILPVSMARNLYKQTSFNPNIKYFETNIGDHYFTEEKYDIIRNFIK